MEFIIGTFAGFVLATTFHQVLAVRGAKWEQKASQALEQEYVRRAREYRQQLRKKSVDPNTSAWSPEVQLAERIAKIKKQEQE